MGEAAGVTGPPAWCWLRMVAQAQTAAWVAGSLVGQHRGASRGWPVGPRLGLPLGCGTTGRGCLSLRLVSHSEKTY